MASLADSFPRRPIRLRVFGAGKSNLIWAALGFLMFAGILGADVYFMVPDLIDEYRLKDSGVLASRAAVGPGGECDTNRGITDCAFDAIYLTQGGERLTHRVHLATVVQGIDDAVPFTVRYDPDAPTHVSTSWGVDMLLNRTISQAVLASLFGLLVFWVIRQFRWRRRLRANLDATCRQPTPVVARFVKVVPGRGYADIVFRWTDPTTNVERQERARFPRTVQPFWLDAGKTTMLGVAGPTGQAYLLDGKLTLADFSAEERARLARFAPSAA